MRPVADCLVGAVFRAALLIVLLFVAAVRLWAGPPFQTDDPEPVEFRHYEFYLFGATDGTRVETDPVGPAFEFNWGAAPNLQLHAVLPFGAVRPRSGPSEYGLLDLELGVKYRFVQQTATRPEVGIFPLLEAPTGDSNKGLGVGRVWYKLPVWAQKDWGHWITYGGGGYQVVHQIGYCDFAYGGWLIQRDVGKRFQLAAEIYAHAHQSPATEAATMVDAGGYYHFKNPDLQLLFSYGHSVAGQAESYAYVGLYRTWGPTGKGSQRGDTGKGGASAVREVPGFLTGRLSLH